jgi:TolB protein
MTSQRLRPETRRVDARKQGIGPALVSIAGVMLIVAVVLVAGDAQSTQQPQPAPPVSQQPDTVELVISGEPGAPPRLAVPDFIALSKDAETIDAAKTIAAVLWNDLAFEREFALIPRDTYATIPAATSTTDIPFDRWRELNADGVIVGSVQRTGNGVIVEARLMLVRTRQSAFAKQYSGSVANKRLYAHTIADEIHQEQRGLKGVARTRLTFNSDRDGERMGGTIESRGVKEIYIADYDGENQRRVTTQRSLNINSVWSADGRSVAYTSYRRGPPNIFVSNLYEGTLQELTKSDANNATPSWSPDGSSIAFASSRDGNFEIYVMNRDGSNVRRLTNHPANDITPTWSPSGAQIAFTSNRGGSPQIYIVGADGLGLQRVTSESYADRPTWSPAPYNQIAYAAQTGPGFDIKVLDLTTRLVTQLTFGEGTNESPTFSPNGRHLAFSSSRAGRVQIFTIARDGRDLRQITRAGNNYQPDWSK